MAKDNFQFLGKVITLLTEFSTRANARMGGGAVLEERASSSRRRAGVGQGGEERRTRGRHADGRAGQRGETREDGKARAGADMAGNSMAGQGRKQYDQRQGHGSAVQQNRIVLY